MIGLTVGAETISTRPASLTVPSSEVRSDRTESGTLPLPSKATETLVNDTFEGTFPGQWQLSSSSTTSWGRTTYRASGGSHSVYCAGGGDNPAPTGGPYFNDMLVFMIFGPFSLADAQEASVAFDLWMKTEPASGDNYYDYLFYGLSLNGQNFSGFITAGDTQGWSDRSFNASEITAINTLGQSQVWLGLAFISDASITDEGVYLDNVVLTKTTSNPCNLTCSASGPSSANAGAPVSFTASATATNCSSQPTYNWDFGDSSQDSTVRNPSHTYSSPGSYTWTMTAQADTQTCTKTGTITVTGSSVDFDRE
ncbi:MAG: PKD domain-containing protein, partial [Acidobacteriota bacterium]